MSDSGFSKKINEAYRDQFEGRGEWGYTIEAEDDRYTLEMWTERQGVRNFIRAEMWPVDFEEMVDWLKQALKARRKYLKGQRKGTHEQQSSND